MIITGDLENGKLRVWQWFPHKVDEKGQPLEHPNGYYVDKIPEYPAPERGFDHIMYYDVEKKEFTFEKKERPLTPDEVSQEQTDLLKDILAELKKKQS